MQSVLKLVAVSFVVALSCASVNAACGGGGYSPKPPVTQSGATAYAVSYAPSTPSVGQREYSNRVQSLQRDIENAKVRLNRCVGDCTSERRRLDDAVNKLNSYVSQNTNVRSTATGTN